MQNSDHEEILLIRQDIKTLKESQNAFHQEMRESLAELKNNYQFKINDHEARVRDLEVTRVNFRGKIEDIKFYLNILSGIGILLVALIVWHLTGYHI